MWIGILTPGAHPSRQEDRGEATLFAWRPEGRAKIDGPFWAAAGGVRRLRLAHRQDGAELCPPRCFVCREPVPVPDPAAARADATDSALAGADGDGPGPGGWQEDDEALPPPPAAFFALVHVDVDTPHRTDPREEEALVVVPDTPVALLVPLAAVPRVLGLLATVLGERPAPRCAGCGAPLPGSVAQRSRAERRAQMRDRGRRARR